MRQLGWAHFAGTTCPAFLDSHEVESEKLWMVLGPIFLAFCGLK
jgi:hypothetical protein